MVDRKIYVLLLSIIPRPPHYAVVVDKVYQHTPQYAEARAYLHRHAYSKSS